MKNGRDHWRIDPRAALVFILWTLACTPSGPVNIQAGSVECDHCHMMIHDMRFHAQLTNAHGKVRHFDSIECALAFRKKNPSAAAAVYVEDFLKPGTHLSLSGGGEPAVIIQSPKIKSPMGGGLAAVRASGVDTVLARFGGALKTPRELEESPLDPLQGVRP